MENLPAAKGALPQEEPLVRIARDGRNALSVSPAVNTRAFHDAFLSLPLPRPVCESAYRQAGRILTTADGTEYEYLVAIDTRSGALVADNLDKTPAKIRTTGFTKKEMDKVRACRSKVAIIHNHPWSTQPSYKDLLTAAENAEVLASVIVGHDSSIWYIAVASSTVADKLASAYNSLKHRLADNAESIAARRLIEEENGRTLDWRRIL